MEIIKKIKLNEADIKAAITNYLMDQGIVIDLHSLQIDIVAGRGQKGISATIDLTETIEPEGSPEVIQTPEPSKSIEELDQEIADEEEDAINDAEDTSDVTEKEPETEEDPLANTPLFGG